MLKSNTEWIQWGETDPLFAVSSWAGKDKAHDAWTDADFYALGASDWADFSREWHSYGMRLGVCVEIGCGAGRITAQLCRDFTVVEALDVSPKMLEYAKSRMPSDNVRFTLVQGTSIPLPEGAADAIFSSHVLQHLDSQEIGFDYFRECFRVMAPNATLMIHVPIYCWPMLFGLYEASLRTLRRLGSFRASFYRTCHLPYMRVTRYSMHNLFAQLSMMGFRDVQVRTICPRSNGDPHPFVFARR